MSAWVAGLKEMHKLVLSIDITLRWFASPSDVLPTLLTFASKPLDPGFRDLVRKLFIQRRVDLEGLGRGDPQEVEHPLHGPSVVSDEGFIHDGQGDNPTLRQELLDRGFA